jgi:hypothetical protein
MIDSYCLLKKGVPDMFLNSSNEEGGEHLGIGVFCSITHARGNSLDCVISLKILVMGVASSTEQFALFLSLHHQELLSGSFRLLLSWSGVWATFGQTGKPYWT